MSENILTRPKLMGMSDFREFVAEVESRVGVENVKLLEDIDRAMNTDERMPCHLDISREKAKELAASSGVEEKKFFSYLAFLHEIEYRKANGPELWERKRGVVPCPDYLPPTKWQVRQGRLPLFNAVSRIWNISLVVVIAGVIPFMIVPLSKFISAGIELEGAANAKFSLFTLIAFTGWCLSAVVFLIAFSIARIMRKA